MQLVFFYQGTVETLNAKAVHLEKEKTATLARIEEVSADMDAAAQRCHQVRVHGSSLIYNFLAPLLTYPDGEEVEEL